MVVIVDGRGYDQQGMHQIKYIALMGISMAMAVPTIHPKLWNTFRSAGNFDHVHDPPFIHAFPCRTADAFLLVLPSTHLPFTN